MWCSGLPSVFSPLTMISGTTIGHEALLKKPCFRCTLFGWLEILPFKTLHCSRIGNWAGEVTPYLSYVSHIRTYCPFSSVTKKILCGYMRLHRAARNLGRWVVVANNWRITPLLRQRLARSRARYTGKYPSLQMQYNTANETYTEHSAIQR